MAASGRAPGTWLGVLSILFWSTSVAVGRGLVERLGLFTATSTVFIVSGLLLCLLAYTRAGNLRRLVSFRPAYLLSCGGLFTGYVLCLYGALASAADHQQVLEVGLLNYLWPTFILMFALPILGHRGRVTLWPGIGLAFAGAALATMQQGTLSAAGWLGNVSANPLPYGLALAGAIAWGLYSNLSRRLGPSGGVGALPAFVLATGVLLLVLRLAAHESPQWTWEAAGFVAWVSLFPIGLAYAFWDFGMRAGNVVLLASLSYAIPVLSTFVSAVFLGIAPRPSIWLACALVVAGAAVCRVSVSEGHVTRESETRNS